MKHLTLERFAYTQGGTYGRLFEGETWTGLWTVEREWLDNRVSASCIPEGLYEVRPWNSQRFGEVMEVTRVPGRTHILFHAANWADQLKGCIAPGRAFRYMPYEGVDKLGVWQSKDGLRLLKGQCGRHFSLRVTHTPRTALELGLVGERDAAWLPQLTCGHEQASVSPAVFDRDAAFRAAWEAETA